jgi:hypothetical protein
MGSAYIEELGSAITPRRRPEARQLKWTRIDLDTRRDERVLLKNWYVYAEVAAATRERIWQRLDCVFLAQP